MKKIAIAISTILLSLLSTTVLAIHTADMKGEKLEITCPVSQRVLNDGVYVGLGLGDDVYRIHQNLNVLDAASGNVFANPNLTANGIKGSIFVGYGRYFDWFYFAGEAFGHFSHASDDNTSIVMGSVLTYHTSTSVRGSYGASLLPGIQINESALLYFRLGFTRTFMKTLEYGSAATLYSTSHTDWYNGVHYGLGFETALSNHVGLRGEVIHTAYGSSDTLLGTKISPSNNEAMLGLLYHFG